MWICVKWVKSCGLVINWLNYGVWNVLLLDWINLFNCFLLNSLCKIEFLFVNRFWSYIVIVFV